MTPAVSATARPLETPLQFVKGVGPRRAAEFAGSGLNVLEDLLLRLPIRYEDRAGFQPIMGVQPGETVSVCGRVLGCGLRRTRRRGFTVFEVLVGDRSGQIRVVFFNQPFLKDVFAVDQHVVLFGKVERRNEGMQFTNPQYEMLADDTSGDEGEPIHTSRIVPVYERIGSVSPKMLRRIVHAALECVPDDVEDPLPESVRLEFGLPGRREALVHVHFPPADASLPALNRFRSPAQRRLIFEECFLFQVGLALRRRDLDAARKLQTVQVDDRIRHAALEVLPFRLTNDQKQALREIVGDLQRPQPMNRLLQGDVGSGKTIVALLAALVAMENGLQVAVMAPTELLAEQHFFNLTRLLEASRFKAVRVVGAQGSQDRREAWDALASGRAQLAVGTHALVQNAVSFRMLGLVVIDEQHRFGVIQRAALRQKGLNPDVLVMTATPIPRTLALTAYGDLDTSVIRELPPGRQPVTTSVKADSARREVYRFVRDQLTRGRQAYVVYPLVEESEKLDLKAATSMAAELQTDAFRDHRVALVHGRLKSSEREDVMRRFVEREVDVLVATTVIEVGVDVANASVMVVEHAERFGLAQLHQLRGRVGRGPHQSYCVLMHAEPLSELAAARLSAIAASADGFELAERDLELRGPGDFFGTRQSGVPMLEVGDLIRDQLIMADARRAALKCVRGGGASEVAFSSVRAPWAERFGLVGVG